MWFFQLPRWSWLQLIQPTTTTVPWSQPELPSPNAQQSQPKRQRRPRKWPAAISEPVSTRGCQLSFFASLHEFINVKKITKKLQKTKKKNNNFYKWREITHKIFHRSREKRKKRMKEKLKFFFDILFYEFFSNHFSIRLFFGKFLFLSLSLLLTHTHTHKELPHKS